MKDYWFNFKKEADIIIPFESVSGGSSAFCEKHYKERDKFEVKK